MAAKKSRRKSKKKSSCTYGRKAVKWACVSKKEAASRKRSAKSKSKSQSAASRIRSLVTKCSKDAKKTGIPKAGRGAWLKECVRERI